jgi:putative ABC transport system permease protein
VPQRIVDERMLIVVWSRQSDDVGDDPVAHERSRPHRAVIRAGHGVPQPGIDSIKLKAGATQTTLSAIQKQWKQFDDEFPFDYFFMDEQLNKFYQSDERLLKVISIFATLAIIIACIGLFGLSIYTAKQRTKVIGIRKVLGASVTGVVQLLSKDFIKLVGIAILIASPIAWWAGNKWLQDFAYRININAWIFISAGIIALMIAMFTVSFQAIKAAIANPVKSLRTE